jgi:hypothetical protein
MVLMNLINLVQLTASVRSVKLLTSADRIGSGFMADIADYPTTSLSQEQFPLLRLSEPDPRSRQEVIDAKSMQAMPPGRGPVGRTGSVSGASACQRSLATTSCANRTKPATRKPVTAIPATAIWSLDASWTRQSGLRNRWCQVDRDCQSHDRHDELRGRDVMPATVRHRATSPDVAAAAK